MPIVAGNQMQGAQFKISTKSLKSLSSILTSVREHRFVHRLFQHSKCWLAVSCMGSVETDYAASTPENLAKIQVHKNV
jgi:DNA uptake protein ComE-like DNA-binding protein